MKKDCPILDAEMDAWRASMGIKKCDGKGGTKGGYKGGFKGDGKGGYKGLRVLRHHVACTRMVERETVGTAQAAVPQRINVAVLQRRVPQAAVAPVVAKEAMRDDQRRSAS